MKLPADIRHLLARRYDGSHRDWLANGDGGLGWPLEIKLGIPSEAQALRQPDAVRAWANAWRAWRGQGEVRWLERRWKVLGTQSLPEALLLSSPADAAIWVGEEQRWRQANERYTRMTARWPALARRLSRLYAVLADYPEEDFQRLLTLLAWLDAHRDSGMYLRQLPVAGLDSKWLESRKAMLAELLAALRASDAADTDFYTLTGLKNTPSLLRMRVLDPALQVYVAGLSDISAPAAQLAALRWQPTVVLIVENLQTGLALGALPGVVAFMGLGYGAEVLAQFPWIRSSSCLYWGDIDTHGYAILQRVRRGLPQVRSLMMDEATLLRFQSLWVEEKTQYGALDLPGLAASEASVYAALKRNAHGQRVRLEQERIAWDFAWLVIQVAVATTPA